MEFIAHRVNTLKELMELPTEYGVELDLRDDLSHAHRSDARPRRPGR